MTVLKILQYPNKKLREKAQLVTALNQKIQTIIKDMFETMYEKNGIGLAATQVGIPLQIIIMIDIDHDEKKIVLINPIIIKKNGNIKTREGCLSIPQERAFVNRFQNIIVKGLNEKGEKKIITAKGTLSVCIQHEIDHLNGILFIDRLSFLKRQIIEKKIKKNKKNENNI
ncbi:peptide deformylase [Buchnera aphidicola (Thelaxes californica)]|uniref:Peptide deformylase n=1 Tax=Buchnera aphidicola (Thelaxes californica) TaxID=1315998 RepID=A0A4D6YLK0_9GAMM|nr:peptide deformylase [Buchnera aphidicola]QCI26900.1 peptide deformylase [Buchnera aphidicola (Thelaxes californica)]